MVDSTSSSTSATSSLISAIGGGSGIDFGALAENLAKAQFAARKDQLAVKSDKLDARISAASNIKSMLLNLDTSLGTLVRSGDLARTPSIANASVATASLTGSAQPTGTFSLEVTQLASGQRIASQAYGASTDTVGSGTLKLRFGTVAGGAFTEDTGHAAVDITIAAGATLADVASAINGANSGVTAYVANTVNGAQLVLRGPEGAANGFVLEATEDAADPGLSNLAWNPSSTNGQLLATAQDAKLKIDGLDVTSSSNAVSEAIPGVKLMLGATNVGAPTTVSFKDPTDVIQSAMSDFTSALNELMAELNKATSIGGDLANDGGARALKRSLSELAGTTIMPGATGLAKTLSDLGLKTQRDGTFSLDAERFKATLAADQDGVVAMFTNGINGVYATFDGIYRKATSISDPGSLGASISRMTTQLSDVKETISDLATKQEELRARMVARFAGTETRISQSKSTLSFLQGQIAIWNNSKN
ncbi:MULTISPECIES: flagellar filament capping protein FliD [Novosphingobium]|uniref:Flagellar hook-associated protein 2 n=1 Tax=Novosphingobium mathurense TaxID=428990 RepID=A0A1U6HHI7_9SPHN|nr:MULTISPECIES: flagellar filament capping protein FliD [Novosphingobium]CDO35558.1 Flagellar hook-associated 2-like protein [Novosphingobium sp. KN65.2]SLJ95295.1 flagellar hook-associated protein 2 [Novosphingobium mathurense]